MNVIRKLVIAALATFGIAAHREPRYPGVWVGEEKIAAVGVKVARGRTRHGFALNVDPDLSMFGHIVPCGIRDRGVTSMARVKHPAVHDMFIREQRPQFGAGHLFKVSGLGIRGLPEPRFAG